MSPTLGELADLIARNPRGLTAHQIADLIETDINSTFGKLVRLYASGRIMKRPGAPVRWMPLP